MTPLFNNNAFTLIELLVVVLIIGILAAVALPQYQKTVEKSRAAQAISLVKSVHQAMHAYYLANGTYPNSFDELAIEIPWPVVANTNNSVYASNDWTVYIFKSDNGLAVAMLRKTGKYKGTGFFMPVTNMLGIQADRLYCAERTLTTSEDLFPTFDGQEGDYCQKIQKSAACVNTSGWLRLCPMP